MAWPPALRTAERGENSLFPFVLPAYQSSFSVEFLCLYPYSTLCMFLSVTMSPSGLAFSLFVATALALPSATKLNERNALYGSVGAVSYTSGEKWYSSDFKSGSSPGDESSSYQCFHGDVDKYPSMNKWMSFNDMYHLNKPAMMQSQSEDIVNHIHDAIVDVSKSSKLDARIILAIIMQEVRFKPPPFCAYI